MYIEPSGFSQTSMACDAGLQILSTWAQDRLQILCPDEPQGLREGGEEPEWSVQLFLPAFLCQGISNFVNNPYFGG